MKKIIGLCVLGGLMATTATAQIKKGTVLLGGQIGGGNNKSTSSGTSVNTESKRNAVNFNISAGKAFAENKVIGIYGGYGFAKYEYAPNVVYQNAKNNSYNAGVFYRQYKSLAKKFYIFGEANLGYYGSNEKSNLNNPAGMVQTIKTNGITFGLTPGTSYQVCKKMQVELTIPALLSLGYQTAKQTYNNSPQTIKTNSFNANATTQSSFLNNVAIGFKFTL
jgi:hypothetical protein